MISLMSTSLIPRSLAIHDGPFHADEVTAASLLLFFDLIDRKKIYRTRDEKQILRCEYVCDVGGIYDPKQKRFDHHQREYQGNLSSAGMVLEFLLKEKIVSLELFSYWRNNFIHGVDAHDLGKVKLEEGFCSFSQVVTNFLPAEYAASASQFNTTFEEALDFVLGHLHRLYERFLYLQSCREKIHEQMAKNSKVLVFDEPLAWLDNFFALGGEKHSALFVIMPTGRGDWKLRAIPPSFKDRMGLRKPLPAKWAGLLEEDLQRVCPISGAVFCHKERFVSIWKTKEAALQALDCVLKEEDTFC